MRLYSLAASVLILCTAPCVHAGDKGGLRDFDYVKGTTPCLNLSNPAALAAWGGRMSKAGVSFDRENGPLVSLNQSADSYQVLAGTESFFRINDRIAFHGGIDWGYMNGQDMGGQILLDPEYNPVNFLESDPATSGPKQRESYSLVGDMSFTANSRWAAGIGFRFDCKDQTKVRDPRFLTYWTDLRVDAGVSFRPSERMLLGASLFYRNTLEQIQGGIYGMVDKQYFVQADKGGFFGTTSELTGDNNHMSLKSRRPMDNTFYGLSLQIAAADRLASELTFAYRNGFYGRKSTGSAVFFEFSGIEVLYDGSYIIPAGHDVHRLSLEVGFKTLGNDENSFSYVTPPGGVTRVEYSGSNHIMDKYAVDGVLGYRWYVNPRGQRPEMTVGSDISFYAKSQHTEVYPFYRDNSVTRIDADVFCSKDIRMDRNILTAELHALGHFGFGVDKEDGQYAAGASSVLKSFDYWLNRQFEYDTAVRGGAAVGLSYTRVSSGRLTPYVKLMDSFMTMFADPEYLDGKIRNIATLTVGCTF